MSSSLKLHYLQALPTLLYFVTICSSVAYGNVPPSQTFTFVNEGEFGEISAEFRADYRALPIATFPFQLSFYNTTPDAFKFAIRMGHRSSGSIYRFVWEANRGRPVRDNAKLSFGTDGNLVLTDSDGTLVWETGTSNKGVVGLKLLPDGNLVLHDSNNKFIWQSFDHPTDTLLAGQALHANGTKRLVGRVSDADGSEGPFSLVMEETHLVMYLQSKNSPQPLLYYRSEEFGAGQGSLEFVQFISQPNDDEGNVFMLGFHFEIQDSTSFGTFSWVRPKFNSTYSFVRVEPDGNLKMYTYYDKIEFEAWETTFKLFDEDVGRENECKLPSKCGLLGVCEDNMCVACPQPQGMLGWSKSCEPPKLASLDYYKVVGVEHFLNSYTEGEGPMELSVCRKRCNMDFGCLGFFYKEESSMCLLAPELRTLIKVSNPKHVGYIKVKK